MEAEAISAAVVSSSTAGCSSMKRSRSPLGSCTTEPNSSSWVVSTFSLAALRTVPSLAMT